MAAAGQNDLESFCKQDANWFGEQVVSWCTETPITDDYTEVGFMIPRPEPCNTNGTTC